MLVELIEKYQKESYKSKTGEPHGIPCSKLDRCNRKIVYHMLRAPESQKDAKFLRICDNGDGAHERLQQYLLLAGVLAKDKPLEREVSGKGLSGRLDAVAHISEEEHIVEIKSVSSKYFRIPAPWHYLYDLQIQAYMMLTNIPRGILLYENKNTQELLEKRVTYSPEIVNDIMIKVDAITECVEKKTLPMRNQIDCLFCEHKNLCYSNKTFTDIQGETGITLDLFLANVKGK